MLYVDWYQNPDNVRRQLGRCKHSWKSLQQIANSRETHRRLETLRQHLSPESKSVKLDRSKTNILEINDANEASVFRSVPCRIRSQKSLRRLASGNRQETFYGIHSPREREPLGEEHVDNFTAPSGVPAQQHCEILGHFACSECTKTKRQRQYSQEVQDTFPYMEMNQRALCANRRGLNMTSHNNRPISLPPISGCPTAPTRDTNRSNTNSAISSVAPPVSTPFHHHFRSTRRTVTDAELQLRVMESHRRGLGRQEEPTRAARKASLYPEVTQPKTKMVIEIPVVSRDCSYASGSGAGTV